MLTFLVVIIAIGLVWISWRMLTREEEIQKELGRLKRELGRLESSVDALHQEAQLHQRREHVSKSGQAGEKPPEAVEISDRPEPVLPSLAAPAVSLPVESPSPPIPSPEPAYTLQAQTPIEPLIVPAAEKLEPPEAATVVEAPVESPELSTEVTAAEEHGGLVDVGPVIGAGLSEARLSGHDTHLVKPEGSGSTAQAMPPAPAVALEEKRETVEDKRFFVLEQVSESGEEVHETRPEPKALPKPALKPASSFWTDLEKSLGGGLLNKIGVGVLVIGFSLLLGYTFQYLGPAGKIAIGYLVVALLLGGGIWLERKPVFSVYGKGLIGGGWALAYFTTYAMHFLPAVRVIDKEWLGLVLLLAAAAGMIAHSLKYRSSIVTGLAYALGFVTILLSHVSLFSLASTLVLSVSLVVICLALGWFRLLVFAPIAAFGCHLAWLYPLVQAARLAGEPLGQGVWSALLILSYWVLFLVPNYAGRRRDDEDHPQMRLLLNLVNFGGFLGLLAYQSQYPQYRFSFLLVVGALYLGLAAWSRRRPDLLTMRLFVTLGAGLLIAAVPMKLTGNWVAYLWLVEVEALLISGFLLRDVYFRVLGLTGFALLLGRLLIFDAFDPSHLEWGRLVVYNSVIVFGWAACAFYFNHYWLYRHFRERISEIEWEASRCFSYCGTLLAVVAIYVQRPTTLLAIGWCLLAVGLIQVGRFRGKVELRAQGHLVVVLAVARLVQFNLRAETVFWYVTQRFWTVALVAALLYFVSVGIGRDFRRQQVGETEEFCRRGILHAASVLIAVLVWFEAPSALIAPAWGVMALVLFELGRWWRNWDLRVQGYAVILAGLVRLVQFNYGAEETFLGLSIRLWTVGLFALILYYLSWRRQHKASDEWDPEHLAQRAMSTVGSALVAVLLWFEVPPALVAPAWGVMALVLLELGRWRRNLDLRVQGYAVMLAGLARLVQFNYGAETRWLTLSLRAWTVSAFAALLYYLSWRLRDRGREAGTWDTENLARRGMLHAGSALVAVLLWYELPALVLAPAFSFAAILLVELGLRHRSLDLRAQGYAMALLGFGRLVAVNLLNEELWNGVSLRVLSGGLVLAHLYYLFFVVRARRRAGELHRWESPSPEILSALAAAGVAGLLRFELVPAWVAPAWGALAAVYLFAGIAWPDLHFRVLGFVLVIATVVRVIFTNLTMPASAPGGLASTSAAVLALFACYALLLWQRGRETTIGSAVRSAWERHLLPACLFTAAALMLVLTYLQAPRNGLTLVWAVEAMLLFIAGLTVRHQAARLLGLGLICFCVLKLFLYDLRGLETFARIISFIGLGLILLAVSFLYTRYSALVRKYL